MTNSSLNKLIDKLNSGKMRYLFTFINLSDTVQFAKVWFQEPKGETAYESAHDFFFIKNQDGLYVAVVFDMKNDLHVYVKKPYRKHGHLSNAMNNLIFPWLYQNGRINQNITFRDSRVRKYFAKYWLFTVVNFESKSAEIDLSGFSSISEIIPKRVHLTFDDFKNVKIKINRARMYLEMIKEQLEAAYRNCGNTYIEDSIEELLWLDDKVQDFIEKENGKPLRQMS
jgi:hypothetical protein